MPLFRHPQFRMLNRINKIWSKNFQKVKLGTEKNKNRLKLISAFVCSLLSKLIFGSFFNYKATIQVSNQFSKPYTCIMKKDIKIQVWTEGPTVIRTNNISLHCTCNKSVVNVVINEPYIA